MIVKELLITTIITVFTVEKVDTKRIHGFKRTGQFRKGILYSIKFLKIISRFKVVDIILERSHFVFFLTNSFNTEINNCWKDCSDYCISLWIDVPDFWLNLFFRNRYSHKGSVLMTMINRVDFLKIMKFALLQIGVQASITWFSALIRKWKEL